PVDPVVEVPEEEEPVDPVVEVPEEEEPVDPVVEVPEEEEPVDPVVEVPEEEEPVDPVVEVPEEEPLQCSSKRAYVLKSSDSTTNITPHRGPLPADVNYNYYSWSGHPIIGSTPKGYEGQFFLYEDGEGAISFNFLFSVDNGGSADNKISLDVVVKNNDSDEQIILSDDRLEIKKISSEDGKSVYQAKMRYWKNTDGGIIGPFTGDDLSINVKLNVVGDTSRLIFYSADGNEIDLGSEFEILANGEVEECSVAVDEEIERNACIDKEYIVRRTEIEDAKWFDEYEEMISNKKEKITVLREEYKLERKEVVTKFNEEIKEQTLEIHEIVKTSRAEQKKLVEYYETKLTELTEIHKKEREVLISELDTKIEEVQTEESRQVCTKQKGLFGFLKRLFCHVVRFIGKAIGAFFKAGEDALLRFLERVGLLGVQISSSTDLIEVKELAVSKLDIEYEEAVKTLIEERDKKVKELVEEYEVKVIEQKAVVVEIKSNKVTAIKELHAELKKEIKAVSETLNIEIKAFKKNAVKIQDAVHREFADSIKECL
ncbi:MAG: hypothetical protein ACRBBP_11225, partial [Bdellovibrionales bacterium]